MAKYRKRPVIVEAEQVLERTVIKTLEGDIMAEAGDWIVTGIKGEKYPVRVDIFEETYDEVGSEIQDDDTSSAEVKRLRKIILWAADFLENMQKAFALQKEYSRYHPDVQLTLDIEYVIKQLRECGNEGTNEET